MPISIINKIPPLLAADQIPANRLAACHRPGRLHERALSRLQHLAHCSGWRSACSSPSAAAPS
ncbi:MAG: hypothetical protein MZV64_60010 [Ignavibacteriales bacterium]|nr:hypothetical protein [Ignavibacteriales bacterium]